MFIIFPKKIFPDDYHKLEAKLVGMFYKNTRNSGKYYYKDK